MSGARRGPPVAWDAVRGEIAFACLDDAGLARALGAMGLYRRVTMPRGDLPGFRPAYAVHRGWAKRMLGSRTEAARGLAQGEWSAEAVALADARDAAERDSAAEGNRAMRDAPCFVLTDAPLDAVRGHRGAVGAAVAGFLRDRRARASVRDALRDVPHLGGVTIYLDRTQGEWMEAAGAASGEDVVSLGAWAWRCGVGVAMARLARLLRVPMWTEADVDRFVAEADAQADAARKQGVTAVAA